MNVPGVRSVLPAESPIAGDVASIVQASVFARDVSADCVSYSAFLRAASGQLSSGRSTAIVRCRSKLDDTLQRGAADLKDSVDRAAQGFAVYADAVESIHRRARSIREEVDDGLAVIRVEAALICEIARSIGNREPASWDDPPPPGLSAPVLDPSRTLGMDAIDIEAAQRAVTVAHADAWRRAASAWIHALDRVRAGCETWKALVDERKAAEGALTSTLQDTPVGQLISLGSGPDSVGPKHTIAHGIAGELWGTTLTPPALVTTHPLLTGLFAGGDGSPAWDSPPNSRAVAEWWGGLDDDARTRLIEEAPWVIGNLPGLPFGVRDLANRASLRFYAENPALLTTKQLRVAAQVQHILSREVNEIEAYGEARPPVQVVALDLVDEVPKAALGYGNSDVATHITWAVPGMNSDANQALSDWDIAGRNIAFAQRQIEEYAGVSSVITWLGYDTPSLVETLGTGSVLRSDSAEVGAVRLAAELDGTHDARREGAGDAPAINVIAHSYGTTCATVALTRVAHPVSSLTLIASAGLDLEHVPDYSVLSVAELEPGQRAIYTTHATGDRLAPAGAGLAGRGLPNADAMGAFGLHAFSPAYADGLSFSSEGDHSLGLLPTDGHSIIGASDEPALFGITASAGHGYLDRDTQSLSSLAQITTGQLNEWLTDSLVRTRSACTTLNAGAGGLVTGRRVTCETGGVQ